MLDSSIIINDSISENIDILPYHLDDQKNQTNSINVIDLLKRAPPGELKGFILKLQ